VAVTRAVDRVQFVALDRDVTQTQDLAPAHRRARVLAESAGEGALDGEHVLEVNLVLVERGSRRQWRPELALQELARLDARLRQLGRSAEHPRRRLVPGPSATGAANPECAAPGPRPAGAWCENEHWQRIEPPAMIAQGNGRKLCKHEP
jgi:hypothetical protein